MLLAGQIYKGYSMPNPVIMIDGEQVDYIAWQ
jgi:hypothetical protein